MDRARNILKYIASYLWLIIGALLAWAAYSAFTAGYIRLNYPSKQQFPIQGIDISHHQGEINWQKLKQENIRFAYIKASEGGDHKDRLFKGNWKKAQAIGLKTGAYHFFTFCRSGVEQAKNFIETVPKSASQLPPAIDLEFGGNCKKTPQKAVLLAQLHDYIQAIFQTYQQKPIIYATPESYKQFLANEKLEGISIWIRGIYKEPELIDKREWIIWQFAHQGRLEGINGLVDLNVFNGDEKRFSDWVGK